MYLNEKQETLVTNNLKLVHYILNKYFGYTPLNPEYEDFVSVGTFGLIKAAKTYDESKSKFSSYSSTIIRNEILMYMRSKKKDKNTISINTPLSADENLTLEDTIEASESSFIETLMDNSELEDILKIIINSNSKKAAIVTLYFLGGKTQHQIGNILNVSQSYVSRLRRRMFKQVKTLLGQELLPSNIFSINILDGSYKISFSPILVPNFNQAFSFILNKMVAQYISSNEQVSDNYVIPDFNINYKEERISIVLPRCTESFLFLAELFNQMYKD
ncbi:MAG: sigma-70 family RNA polymerase sigma factor [Clostridia bacterium]|nr:sigma-70 family RNA polymerase sigma factor [Clostridia bacterium]